MEEDKRTHQTHFLKDNKRILVKQQIYNQGFHQSNHELLCQKLLQGVSYCKVTSSNSSCLEAHAGFFQIAYEGDF